MIRARRSIDLALAAAALCFSVLAFWREGTAPLAELRTLAFPSVWASAAPTLGLLLALAIAGSITFLRSGRVPAASRAAVVAAAATSGFAFAYDWCADDVFPALPQGGGCHCWVVGVSGALAALAVALIAAVARRFLARAIARLAAIAAEELLAPNAPALPILQPALPGGTGAALAPVALHRALRAPPSSRIA